ncbi:RND family transporter [Pararhizobium sp. IMCC21322]|uniref:efflux RND transporter permease subunit n=1 Tax=Pararhizobium sp. IMCC21322 TaxID=3067903 RepID=UPI0027422CBC|nr:MMPL family transporter [Pararhizobium sp. IMCC21322]
MTWGIGFGAERFGLAALRFPKIAALCILVLLAAIGASLPRISFDDDIHRVFLSDSLLSQAQRDYEAKQSPPVSTVLIHVTSPDPFSVNNMTALRDLSLDLEFLDGVSAVASPFSLRLPPTATAPSGVPLFAPEIRAGFSDDLASFKALKTGLPIFLNDALTAMVLSVSVNSDQTSVARAMQGITAELDRVLPPELSATITGEDVISAEIVSGLKNELISLNLWGALIVTIAAFGLLRDLRMALLAVVPAIVGAAGVLALSVWLGYPITVLNNVIPILLLVLGVADGVHLSRHFKDTKNARTTIVTVGPACALTAITTTAAFASIMLTGNEQLFEFAVLGAIGTMFAFVIVIITFPLMANQMTLSAKPVLQQGTFIAKMLIDTGAARPRITAAIGLVLLAVSTFGFMQTKAWFPLYQNLPDDSPIVAANNALSDDFGGVFQMIIESDGDWETTRRIADSLETVSAPQTVLSQLNFARWLGTPEQRPTPAQLEMLPTALVEQLQPTGTTSRIFVSMPEPMLSAATLAQFDRLHDAALAAEADRIIGLPTIMRYEAVSLISQLSRGLVVAALGATLLVALAFRSVRLVPVLLIPNVLPLMLTGASLHIWAQGQLSPTAVLALTISFGIAIDDTVHFLSRYFTAKEQGSSTSAALGIAAGSAGEVMVLTTLLLTAGLCVTLFSAFTPIRLFGGMMITTLFAALLIDLLLLPALLSWREKSRASI